MNYITLIFSVRKEDHLLIIKIKFFFIYFISWIKFQKTAHTIRFNELPLFTTDKLQVNASFTIFYFLK